MKLLMLAVLAFTPMQQQVDPCIMQPTSFTPPAATACPPPGMMNYNCVLSCNNTYQLAMTKAFKRHCYREKIIQLEWMDALSECAAEYDTCVYEGGIPDECEAIRLQCQQAAGATATAANLTNDNAHDQAVIAATIAHAICTAGCCEQQ